MLAPVAAGNRFPHVPLGFPLTESQPQNLARERHLLFFRFLIRALAPKKRGEMEEIQKMRRREGSLMGILESLPRVPFRCRQSHLKRESEG